MNAALLKSKMVLAGDEDFVKVLSTLLGVTRQTASAKLNNESECTQTEIAKISKHYGFDDKTIREIFIEGDNENDSKRSSETSG